MSSNETPTHNDPAIRAAERIRAELPKSIKILTDTRDVILPFPTICSLEEDHLAAIIHEEIAKDQIGVEEAVVEIITITYGESVPIVDVKDRIRSILLSLIYADRAKDAEIAKRLGDLAIQCGEQKVEIEADRASLDLRFNADRRAIALWQKAHPDQPLVWPDHADLCVWLLSEREADRAEKAEIAKRMGDLAIQCGEQEAEIERLREEVEANLWTHLHSKIEQQKLAIAERDKEIERLRGLWGRP